MGRADLWALLAMLAARGATVVMSTHESADAALCDSVSELREGRLQ
jgi:ABC-type multidrug transport system ATPase subunit